MIYCILYNLIVGTPVITVDDVHEYQTLRKHCIKSFMTMSPINRSTYQKTTYYFNLSGASFIYGVCHEAYQQSIDTDTDTMPNRGLLNHSVKQF